MSITRPWTWFKEWNNLNGTQQSSAAILVIGAVISIITYAEYGSGKAYYTLVASTTAALLFDRMTRYVFENNLVDEVSKFNLSALSLHYIGDSVTGLHWLTRNYHDLYSVDNTVYRPIHEYHSGYIEEHYSDYIGAIKKAIDGGCGWRDYALTPHMAAVHQFYDSLDEKQKKRYHAYEIQQDMPMFQLTIFRYRDRNYKEEKAEISFGWGFGGNHSRVYMSSDHRTTEFFEEFFTILRQGKNIRKFTGLTFLRLCGPLRSQRMVAPGCRIQRV